MRLSLRPPLPVETDWEKLSVLTLLPLAVAGRLWLWYRIPLPPCPMKHFTGCPCPGCGSTRAAHALFSGDATTALSLNPLATLIALSLVPWLLYSLVATLFGKGRRLRIDGLPSRAGTLVRIGVATLVLANWAWVIATLPESPWRCR